MVSNQEFENIFYLVLESSRKLKTVALNTYLYLIAHLHKRKIRMVIIGARKQKPCAVK